MKMLLMVLSLSALTVMLPQNIIRHNHLLKISEHTVIVLAVHGCVNIDVWSLPSAELEVENNLGNSTLWGFGNSLEKLKEYDVSVKTSGDTIFIAKQESESEWCIGVFLNHSTQSHFLRLPKYVRVIFKSRSAEFNLRGNLSFFKLDNTSGLSRLYLRKNDIGLLHATGQRGKIQIGNDKYENEYDYESSGGEKYLLNTGDGEIHVYLQ